MWQELVESLDILNGGGKNQEAYKAAAKEPSAHSLASKPKISLHFQLYSVAIKARKQKAINEPAQEINISENKKRLGFWILPPLNSESLVIPVLFGAKNIDVRVDTRLRHGQAIRNRDLDFTVISFDSVVDDDGGGGGVSVDRWDREGGWGCAR